MGLDYRAAGVDKEEGYAQVRLIKDLVSQTYTDQVISDLGGFSAMVELDLSQIQNPVLVAGTDGVGTKVMLAQAMDIHNTVGRDLVAMCVNDIICQGARPLFFLDYIATGKLIAKKMALIVEGIVEGCLEAGAALVGGETAEMPGLYGEDEYDLAGFALGLVDKDKIITGQSIKEGDLAIGLPSSGVHSNGFSLVRAILDEKKIGYDEPYGDGILGQALLEPTRIYAKEVLALIDAVEVKGLAHITGGGLYENLARVIPPGLGIEIGKERIPSLEIFSYLQELGEIESKEMYSTFNMGVGMVAFVDPADRKRALASLQASGIEGFDLGQVTGSIQGVEINV